MRLENKKGKVHSLETFGLVDGPGVRCVIFLQGCHMRCRYCHNPETWDTACGQEYTPQEIFQKVYRYRSYWKDNGGITISGGEPLLQIGFVTEVFRLAKEKGVHTTLDTSGNPFRQEEKFLADFEKLMEVTDLVMLDMKEMDSDRHRELTGHRNENILAMAQWLNDHGKPMWIRHVLVPGLTDTEESLESLRQALKQWRNVEKVEILPYHTLGVFKWEKLGLSYPLDGVEPPTEQEVARAERLLGIEKE
jgi:pyruvate formate lyase activating enzyme